VRAHDDAVNQLDFVPQCDQITVDYAPGEATDVQMHDGSVLRLRKLAADYDPADRTAAISYEHEHQAKGEVVTGLLYVDPQSHDLHEHLNTVAVPLNTLSAKDLCPGQAVLDKINASLR
jgi:2-oxoglutarate ferredoxin oxidoreductase subunit beta